MNRLRTVLKAIMLRRKKDSLLDGKPIVRLPPKTESVVQVELSTDERDFYNQLEKKSQVIFNKYLRDGSVGKNYSNILVLLLRLRQACCHPHLNLDVEDAVTRSDEDMEALVKQLDPSSVARIKALDTFECPICYDAVPSPCFFVPCGHDSCSQCLAHLADSSDATNIQAGIDTAGGPKARCPVCRELFDPTKCFTLEAFQKVHQPEKIKKEEAVEDSDHDDLTDSSETDDDDDEDDNDDDVDNKGNLRGFIVEDDFNSDMEDADNETKDVKSEVKSDVKLDIKQVPEVAEDKKPKIKTKRRNKGKGKAKDTASDVKPSMLKALRKEASKNRAAYKKYMAYLRKTWLPSVKSTECINLLKTIQETGEKTIVFSQWTLLLDLIEVGMKHEGFEHPPVRYDGGMSATDRNDSATKFRNSKTANVILVSLKAGNAGLNLAAASRVIILDPFWNPYIEMQAIDRAYRIGQQREVQVHRILTEATVEDRIIALQEKKKNMIESAMDEAEGRKISRLSINELKYLFNGS
jgi:SNF2 family DNA or RNA helicase